MKKGDIGLIPVYFGNYKWVNLVVVAEKSIPHPEGAHWYRVVFPTDFKDGNGGGTDRFKLIGLVDKGIVPYKEYSLEELESGEISYEVQNYEVVITGRANKNITEDYLKKAFEYIPVRQYGLNGFIKDKETSLLWVTTDKKGKQIDPKATLINTKADPVRAFSVDPIIKHCKAKVISCTDSVKLFGKPNIKKNALDKIFEIDNLEVQAEVKKSDNLEDTIWLNIEGTKYRFVLSDIKLIYPNIKGYNPKKDNTIKTGHTVKCINDKHCFKLNKGDTVRVDHIKLIGDKSYIGFIDNEQMIYMKKKNFKLV